jgi:hypothetical protein
MKTILVILLFVASAFAQINPTVSLAAAACGPIDVRFDVKTFASLPTAGPESGKALVFVVEDFRNPGALWNPTIRVGLDGAWKGATRASSYLYFPVDPGEHHLCANWQSILAPFSQLTALAHLNAEPGQTYYFRAHIYPGQVNLDLDRLDTDEGRFLVASFPLSKSHPKK